MDSQVIVFPFTRRADGNEVHIGRHDGGSFLALSPDAVEVLDDLASGSSLDEAAMHYQAHYSQLPDIDGLVSTLESEGFVRRTESHHIAPRREKGPYLSRFHFSDFPEAWGRRLFSKPVLVAGYVAMALALAAIAADPRIVPSPRALYFSSRLGVAMLWLAPLFALQICVHELSHMAAARARGVRVRFGVSHRLWLLVLETDMTGIWMLERGQRYLPMLAGSFVDGFTVSLLLILEAAVSRSWILISPLAQGILRALIVIYLYQILWQCFLFIRTDFYYVFANYFGCKDLMSDTRIFLSNSVKRIVGRGVRRGQGALSATERRVVRVYSGLWILGRGLALYVLFFIQIPLVWLYLKTLGRSIAGHGGPSVRPELLVPMLVTILTFALGMFLWSRSVLSTTRTRRMSTAGPGRVTSND